MPFGYLMGGGGGGWGGGGLSNKRTILLPPSPIFVFHHSRTDSHASGTLVLSEITWKLKKCYYHAQKIKISFKILKFFLTFVCSVNVSRKYQTVCTVHN